jgi:hypothetical protein
VLAGRELGQAPDHELALDFRDMPLRIGLDAAHERGLQARAGREHTFDVHVRRDAGHAGCVREPGLPLAPIRNAGTR